MILSDIVLWSDRRPACQSDRIFRNHYKDAFLRNLILVEEDENISAVLEIYYFKAEVGEDLEAFWDEARREERDLITCLSGFFKLVKTKGGLKRAVSPNNAAVGLVALFNGLIELMLMHKEQVSLRDSTKAVLNVFFSGIEP